MTDDRSLLARSPGVVWRRAGPEVVLAPRDRVDFEVLSPTGAAVWLLLERPQTLADLVGELSRRFGAPEARILPDVSPLLDQLVTQGLVDVVADGDD